MLWCDHTVNLHSNSKCGEICIRNLCSLAWFTKRCIIMHHGFFSSKYWNFPSQQNNKKFRTIYLHKTCKFLRTNIQEKYIIHMFVYFYLSIYYLSKSLSIISLSLSLSLSIYMYIHYIYIYICIYIQIYIRIYIYIRFVYIYILGLYIYIY